MRVPDNVVPRACACDGARGCHPAVRGRAEIPIHPAIVAAPVAHDPFR